MSPQAQVDMLQALCSWLEVRRSVCELQRLRERHPKAGAPPATAMGTPSKIAGWHFQGQRHAQALSRVCTGCFKVHPRVHNISQTIFK